MTSTLSVATAGSTLGDADDEQEGEKPPAPVAITGDALEAESDAFDADDSDPAGMGSAAAVRGDGGFKCMPECTCCC
jgi:hypothetical protein